jgi:hypothetical protein
LANYRIDIDMDSSCAECEESGALGSGVCMDCAIKVMGGKKLKSDIAKNMRARIIGMRNASAMAIMAEFNKKVA